MTDREIKNMLKNAYQTAPTEREKAFIRANEQRSLRLFDVLKLEMKYMGVKCILSGLLFCTGLIAVAKAGDLQTVRYISSLFPLMALMLTELLGKTEKYGMSELEASTRFSLKFIRLVRMLLLGSISLGIICAFSLAVKNTVPFGLITLLGFMGVPYLANVFGSLLITRKWHSEKNYIGCIICTAVSCALPSVLKFLLKPENISPLYPALVLLIVSSAVIRESILFIRESGELAWN